MNVPNTLKLLSKIKPVCVSYKLNHLYNKNCVTSNVCGGIIYVANTIINNASRPLKLILEKPYAAKLETQIDVNVVRTVTLIEFQYKSKKGIDPVQTSR